MSNEPSIEFIDLLLTSSRKLRVLFDARIRDNRLMRQHNLTLSRARVLLALKNNNDFYQKNLAAELEIENATLVRLIDALEVQGLVVRDIDKGDRRAKFINLTHKGRDLAKNIEAFAKDIRREVMANIATHDIAHGLSLLNQLLDRIEKFEIL